MIVSSLGLRALDNDPLTLLPDREQGEVRLIIGGSEADIRLERSHLEDLRDQIPGALAVMDTFKADDAACGEARQAERRAVDAAARVRSAAAAAEQAGDVERAAVLRDAADGAEAAAGAADAVIRAVNDAVVTADRAAEYALGLTLEEPLGGDRDAG